MRTRASKRRRTRRKRQRGGNPYVIVFQPKWGFGNQIIEYCIACAIKKRFNYEMLILPPLDNIHSANRDYRDLFTRGKKTEKMPDNFMNTSPYIADKNDRPLNISEIPQGKNIYIDKLGFFYSVIKDIMPELGNEMHLRLNMLCQDLPFKNDKTQGFIHVRRGDFVTNGIVKDYKFYNSAIILANTKTDVKKWKMFSDDIAWCKNQKWNSPEKIEFVDEPDEVKALAIMSNCFGGAIVSQSSFGWAGAVTGAYINKGIVISHSDNKPHTEHGYIGPPDWIYLDDEGNVKEYK
jgi:hypothetical protein